MLDQARWTTSQNNGLEQENEHLVGPGLGEEEAYQFRAADNKASPTGLMKI